MSYNPSATSTKNPFFSAYRDSNQTPSVPGDFLANNFKNCTEDGSSTGKIKLDQKSYIIGELRAVASGTTYNLYDIAMSGSDELAEGYQVRCNAIGTVLMDDACYGIADVNDSICIRAMNDGTTTSANAQANQIRIFGMRVR